MKFSFESVATAQAYRISPNDTNYFVLLFDREKHGIDNIFVVEIFTEGGATPPNTHAHAHELYTLTVMTPNDGFAELIRAGEPVALDEEDRRALAAR
jgi:hypothetical protein